MGLAVFPNVGLAVSSLCLKYPEIINAIGYVWVSTECHCLERKKAFKLYISPSYKLRMLKFIQIMIPINRITIFCVSNSWIIAHHNKLTCKLT